MAPDDPLDGAREVIRRCRALARCTETPGVTTRTFLSPPMHDVHRTLREWMAPLALDTRVDAAGNFRAVRPASSPDAPRLLVGSHLDTVPNAGAFDGILGVVLGLAILEQVGSTPLPFSIELLGFSEEEGVRFGVPFIGSRALLGTLDAALLATVDDAGVSVAQAIRDFGLDPGGLRDAGVSGRVLGVLEMHIEQGPVLDALDLPLGIVDAIVGLTRGQLRFDGRANHAGTTPMAGRADALAAAAEWVLAVESLARRTAGLVATVGRIDTEPGATNVIAGVCRCSLDVRHRDDRQRAIAVTQLLDAARAIAAARGLTAAWEARLEQPAIGMDARLIGLLERATRGAGLPVHHMSSGAGHDAMILAARVPAAMLFVRSPGGVSHHPDESVREEDVAAALRVGRDWILALAAAEGRHG